MRIASSLRGPRRALLGLTIVAAALTAWTVPARAEGEVVTIAPLEGVPVQVSLDDPELVRDIEAQYELRFSDGGAPMRQRVRDGVTLLNLLVRAGLDESEFAYVEIQRPPGASLGTGPIRIPAADLGGGKPPAVYVDGDGTMRFIRASSGPKDFNGDDWIELPDGAMAISQLPSDGLSVTIEASRQRIEAGESIHFTADVEGGTLDAEYEYVWFFGDGNRGRDRASVEHEFEEAGRFLVELTVRGTEDGTRGGADPLHVRVGESKDTGPGPGAGGSNDEADAPSTGTYSDGTSGDYSYDGGSDQGYDYSYEGGSADTPPPAPRSGRQDGRDTGFALDDGTVEGYLLADASTPPSSAAADAVQAARAGFVDDRDDRGSIPAAVWALLGTVVLVTAGAGLEGRPSPPRSVAARVPRMRGGALERLLRRKRS